MPVTRLLLRVNETRHNDANEEAKVIISSIRFKSHKPNEELVAMSKAGSFHFREIEGLEEMYRVTDVNTGEVGGIYIWDNEQAMRDFVEGPIVKGIGEHYDVVGTVRIEILEVSHTLHT